MLYFDHNATHPLSPVAREAWLRATQDFIGNPSSPHRLGARAEVALNQAREKLAGWLGCDVVDIVWTSGATEANNAALHHASHASDGEVWISAIEHPCVMEASRRFFAGRQQFIPVDGSGVVDLDWLAEHLKRSRPALVGIMASNNETGVLQPWRQAMELCRAQGVPFFCDAAQWIGKLPAAGLGGADFLSGCAHKFGGPQGIGFLKVPAKFQPLLVGGAAGRGAEGGDGECRGDSLDGRGPGTAGGGVECRGAGGADGDAREFRGGSDSAAAGGDHCGGRCGTFVEHGIRNHARGAGLPAALGGESGQAGFCHFHRFSVRQREGTYIACA